MLVLQRARDVRSRANVWSSRQICMQDVSSGPRPSRTRGALVRTHVCSRCHVHMLTWVASACRPEHVTCSRTRAHVLRHDATRI